MINWLALIIGYVVLVFMALAAILFILWAVISEIIHGPRSTTFFQAPEKWGGYYLSPFEILKYLIARPYRKYYLKAEIKARTKRYRERYNDPAYDGHLWDNLKDRGVINEAGLLSLISKLKYEPGDIREKKVIGALVLSLLPTVAQPNLYGVDLDKDKSRLVSLLEVCGSGLNESNSILLIDSLKEKIVSFGLSEVNLLYKGKFFVRDGQVIFFENQKRHRGYQPEQTADSVFNKPNPPQGGSGIPSKV